MIDPFASCECEYVARCSPFRPSAQDFFCPSDPRATAGSAAVLFGDEATRRTAILSGMIVERVGSVFRVASVESFPTGEPEIEPHEKRRRELESCGYCSME